MRTFMKLVRDLIPEHIRAEGRDVSSRVLNDCEFERELLKKLAEEASELAASRSIEEVADVLEVTWAIASQLGFTQEQVLSAVERKRRESGGFSKRIFLSTSD
jgi:predicted house-cleaning noncanonical NTP pyrophosphatase (MazG superfamily)